MNSQSQPLNVPQPILHRGIWGIAISLLMSACVSGQDFVKPAPPDITALSVSSDFSVTKSLSTQSVDGNAQLLDLKGDVAANWWESYQSLALNAAIEEALKNNQDLKAAEAALRQAKELAYAAGGAELPQIGLNSSINYEKISRDDYGLHRAPGSAFTLYNATVDVSYAPDIFGGLSRQIESLEAQAKSIGYQKEAVYITLVANIVTTAVQEASDREQIKAIKDVTGGERDRLGLMRRQMNDVNANDAFVFSQEAIVAQADAILPALQLDLAQKHDELAILMGRFPGDPAVPIFTLDSFQLPKTLPVSIPSSLVEQRPDIKAAEALLQSANAKVGVADANMLPKINLVADYGTAASKIGNLFSPQAEVGQIAGGLFQPIFAGGQLLHESDAAKADYQRVGAQYQSTVRLAFKNVSDVLHALQYDAAWMRANSQIAKVSQKSMDSNFAQFLSGDQGHISFLEAEKTGLDAKLNIVRARGNRLADTAALFQALGGGWWNRGAPISENHMNTNPYPEADRGNDKKATAEASKSSVREPFVEVVATTTPVDPQVVTVVPEPVPDDPALIKTPSMTEASIARVIAGAGKPAVVVPPAVVALQKVVAAPEAKQVTSTALAASPPSTSREAAKRAGPADSAALTPDASATNKISRPGSHHAAEEETGWETDDANVARVLAYKEKIGKASGDTSAKPSVMDGEARP